MNTAIQWLYGQFDGIITPGSAHCYLCGIACEPNYTVKLGLADTFNSHFLCLQPHSSWLCSACYWYFAIKNHPDFRKMSLIVKHDSWQQWQRDMMKNDIEQWLTLGIEGDAYLVCSLSKKKHILLQSPMNANGSHNIAVQIEEQIAHLEYAMWEYMDRRFQALLKLGHGKGEILSGQLYGSTLKKHQQIANALFLSQELEPYRNSAVLELLSYVTILEPGENDVTGNDATAATDGTLTSGSIAPESRMESDRPRIQEQVPDGHLDAIRVKRPGVRTDEQHPGEVSQHPLW